MEQDRIKELEVALHTAVCALKTIAFQGYEVPRTIAERAYKQIESVLHKTAGPADERK